MDNRRFLHPVDYAVLAVVLAVSMGIGLYYAFTGGRQRTTQEFLLADRRLKVQSGFGLINSPNLL